MIENRGFRIVDRELRVIMPRNAGRRKRDQRSNQNFLGFLSLMFLLVYLLGLFVGMSWR